MVCRHVFPVCPPNFEYVNVWRDLWADSFMLLTVTQELSNLVEKAAPQPHNRTLEYNYDFTLRIHTYNL